MEDIFSWAILKGTMILLMIKDGYIQEILAGLTV